MPLAEADLMTKVFAIVSLSLSVGRRSSCGVFVSVHGVHICLALSSPSPPINLSSPAARIFGTDDGARDGVGDSTDAATATKREPE